MSGSFPVIKGSIVTYWQEGREQQLVVGSSNWYDWLETITTFTFIGEQGNFTARKERAGTGRGAYYWRAYLRKRGRLYRLYLGQSNVLTLHHLQQCAELLIARAEQGATSADETQSPVLESSLSHKGALPPAFTPLIGREKEIFALLKILLKPNARLVTLIGAPGVGKTRLSMQLAAELLTHFANNVYFIPFTSITDPEQLLSSLASSLDIQEQGVQSLTVSIKMVLRENPCLLILDNFEYLIQAADLLEELLAACPALKIVVTSRIVLRSQAEHVFTVRPLAVPVWSQDQHIESFAQYAAIALFVQRAEAHLPTFALTEENVKVVAEICMRLDGLPLAIELVVAHIRWLSPQMLLARLTRNLLSMLERGSQTLPPHQRTLRATLHWSYALLNKREQSLFRTLSVFVGSFTLSAAETVARLSGDDPDDYSHCIASLIDKGLLQQADPQAEDPALTFLTIIRAYALELLAEAGEESACQRTYAFYYLSLVENAEADLHNQHQLVCLQRLVYAHDNIQAALQWFLTHKMSEQAAQLCGIMAWFWLIRGSLSEGQVWSEKALAISEDIPVHIHAKLLQGIATLAIYQDNYARLLAVARLSEPLVPQLPDGRDRAIAISLLGTAALLQGKRDMARTYYEACLASAQNNGDLWIQASRAYFLANEALARMEIARCHLFTQKGLQTSRMAGDQWLYTTQAANLGNVFVYYDDIVSIETIASEGIALCNVLGIPRSVPAASHLCLLGFVAFRRGEIPIARAFLEKSLLIQREMGHLWGFVETACLLARLIHQQEGPAQSTLMLLEESLSMARQMQSLPNLLRVLASLGSATFYQGDRATFLRYFQELLALLKSHQRTKWFAYYLEEIAEILVKASGWLLAAQLWGMLQEARDQLKLFSVPPPLWVTVITISLEKEAFQKAIYEGRILTPEQALTVLEHYKYPEQVLHIQTLPSPQQPLSLTDGLTKREGEILRLLALGWKNKQIASYLTISHRTVSTHVASIYQKIHISSRSGATRYALLHKLI